MRKHRMDASALVLHMRSCFAVSAWQRVSSSAALLPDTGLSSDASQRIRVRQSVMGSPPASKALQ
jgi:hypothetical protein